MSYSENEKEFIIDELKSELKGRFDGARKNLIAEYCPYCHKKGKFAVYVGKSSASKPLFASHCFSCGKSNRSLKPLLEYIGRYDLITEATTELDSTIEEDSWLESPEEEIDDFLNIIDLPQSFKRCFTNDYLNHRGFIADDYSYFPVGTTNGFNFKLDDYVIFEIIDDGDVVGWVGRHIWSKEKIDKHNIEAKRKGKFCIMRYKNSTENDFVKLLYNYDSIVQGVTDTAIIVEGIFDAIALTRKLELYDNKRVAVVATFGKKISDTQIFKLQSKGIKNVVLAYDGDEPGIKANKEISNKLKTYFDTFVADIDGGYDFDELDTDSIYDVFSNRLKTPLEYNINKL